MHTLVVERLHARAVLPARATADAAGLDVRAAWDTDEPGVHVLEPGTRLVVPTGLRFAIPCGWEMQVRSRSGLAAKHGVMVLNSPGTIDADYRGELQVLLYNAGDVPFPVAQGDRVAQLVLSPVHVLPMVEAVVPVDTARGVGGFGHTGVR